jgi:aerobic C4-dicarboxylate transport protein
MTGLGRGRRLCTALTMASPSASPKKRDTLFLQVIIGVVAGIAVGLAWPHFGTSLKPIAESFVALVRMLVTPIIFLTVVLGIGGMSDLKKVGRVGGQALLYFEIVTTFALALGLIVANVWRPGAGMNIPAASLNAGAVVAATKGVATVGPGQFLVNLVLHLIPASFAGPFVENDLLQVLVLAILFGFALGRVGEPVQPVIALLHQLARIFFDIVAMITRLAPLAAFGAMAFTVGTYGVHTLVALAQLLLAMLLTCLLFIFGVLALIARAHGFSLWRLLRHIREELFIAGSTSSSETALPGLMEKMKLAGCPAPVVGLVVPAGYSFNLDGTCIYLTLAAIFIAQATNTPFPLPEQLYLLLILMIMSKGSSGVTGSGFITLAAVLATTNSIPVAGLALILGVDRFMSMMRTFTNLIGNAVATLVVSSYDPDFDAATARATVGRQRG